MTPPMCSARVLLLSLLPMLMIGCASPDAVTLELEFRDSRTREPIRDAQIEIEWGGYGLFGGSVPRGTYETYTGTTDSRGKLIFSPVSDGFWDVTVDHAGYDVSREIIFIVLPEDGSDVPTSRWERCRILRKHPFAPDRTIDLRIVSVQGAVVDRPPLRP